MASLFEKNLTRMKEELRDLKTNHNIPVGSLIFYSASKSVSLAQTAQIYGIIYIRITMKAGERANPYAQLYISEQSNQATTNWGNYFSVENDGMIYQFADALPDGKTYDIKAISTSDFDFIAKEYENGDWIGVLPE